jgi:hypothetical protein
MINRAPSLANSDNDSLGMLAHPNSKQLVDLILYLRRRR